MRQQNRNLRQRRQGFLPGGLIGVSKVWFGLVKDRALGPRAPGPPLVRLRLRADYSSAVPRTVGGSGARPPGPAAAPRAGPHSS